jgi:biotin transport system substrate-specific component
VLAYCRIGEQRNLVGLPWLAVSVGANPERTLELGLYPFVLGDVLKLYLAGMLLPGAWRVVGAIDARR